MPAVNKIEACAVFSYVKSDFLGLSVTGLTGNYCIHVLEYGQLKAPLLTKSLIRVVYCTSSFPLEVENWASKGNVFWEILLKDCVNFK